MRIFCLFPTLTFRPASAMMTPVFDYRLPSPGLRDYVRQLQIVGCHFPAEMTQLPVKAYWPRAENCLSFFPRDPEQVAQGLSGPLQTSPACRLAGQPTLLTSRHVGRDFLVLQVVFQPGALHRLTGLPLAELNDTLLDAETVFAGEIRQVSEQLRNTRHYPDMIPVVEAFLARLIRRARPDYRPAFHKATEYLLCHPGQTSLDWLAGQACMSGRQFHRQFVERQGISPKLFARIARFGQAMRLKNAQPLTDWLSVALAVGYHDYQHLARDFRQFTGLSPNAFLLHEGQAPERVFGQAETSDSYH
ncbi:helix-turn-helix domain-containing protein [Hymenobacter sp. APR13]|uniref:helix-turn-helix domain-containing protein n=1 Tax=Hymenobacter sp. APR13 TaxID=1356852 RepID=UPI001E4D2ED7|nr:helix-turn-helix domain-containing protein [Hymenobacter sp. APR13]